MARFQSIFFYIKKKVVLAVGLLLAMVVVSATASTFYILPQFNPAFLSFVKDSQLFLGPYYVDSQLFYNGTTTVNQLTALPTPTVTGSTVGAGDFFGGTAYIAKRLNPKWVVALRFNEPIQGRSIYDTQGPTRYTLTTLKIHTANIDPEFSWQPFNFLTVGAGIDFERFWATRDSTIAMTNFPAPGNTDSVFRVEGAANDIGWHAGLMLHPHMGTYIGLNYTSSLAFLLRRGHSSLSTITPTIGATTDFTLSNQVTKADILFPAIWTLDVIQALSRKLILSAYLDYKLWQRQPKDVIFWNTVIGNQTLVLNFHNTVSTGGWVTYKPTQQWEIGGNMSYAQQPDQIPYYSIDTTGNVFGIGGKLAYKPQKNIKLALTYQRFWSLSHGSAVNNAGDPSATSIITNARSSSKGNYFLLELTLGE